jgi:hypothetical protein
MNTFNSYQMIQSLSRMSSKFNAMVHSAGVKPPGMSILLANTSKGILLLLQTSPSVSLYTLTWIL